MFSNFQTYLAGIACVKQIPVCKREPTTWLGCSNHLIFRKFIQKFFEMSRFQSLCRNT